MFLLYLLQKLKQVRIRVRNAIGKIYLLVGIVELKCKTETFLNDSFVFVLKIPKCLVLVFNVNTLLTPLHL
jgi:hypothetical protein